MSSSSLPSHPFVCLSQGLSLNPEPTELKILARLADGECPEFLCPHSPVMGSQACTDCQGQLLYVDAGNPRSVPDTWAIPYSLNYIPNLVSIVFSFYF